MMELFFQKRVKKTHSLLKLNFIKCSLLSNQKSKEVFSNESSIFSSHHITELLFLSSSIGKMFN